MGKVTRNIGVQARTIRPLVLALMSAVLVAGSGEWTEDAEDLVSTVDVDAVLGRTASLPCDVTPDANEDRVYMVLWFRKSGGKPIYRGDSGGALIVNGFHQIGIVSFRMMSEPALVYYTNVTYYYDWIIGQAKAKCEEMPLAVITVALP